jgi:hypothetical protein
MCNCVIRILLPNHRFLHQKSEHNLVDRFSKKKSGAKAVSSLYSISVIIAFQVSTILLSKTNYPYNL